MGYLWATSVLLIVGRQHVPGGVIIAHTGVLGAIAAATWAPRVPAWLRAWAPLMSLLFLYSELPMLIRAAGHLQFFDMAVISWESGLFGGQPAVQWSLRWPSRALSELLHAAYLSYYGIIFVVPVALWITRRRRAFDEAVFVLLLTFLACFVCYIMLPVEGPRYLWPGPDGSLHGPIRAVVVWLLESRSSQGTAFPSSHVAVATTQGILAVRYFGWRGAALLPLGLGLALGAIYGGFHYAIDVVAGAVLGAITAAVGLIAVRLTTRAQPPVQANATAPT